MHPNSSPLAEAERQLELQRQLIVALTPELYRQLALYLQVLRKGLLHAVQQACFHLATQTYPERFSAIGPSRRLELQERLQALVQRCNCLLTVEQLMGLAAQLQSRQQRQRRRDQQRLLLALAAEQDSDEAGEGAEGEDQREDQDNEGEGAGRRLRRPDERPPGQPRGSVQLGLDLPLSADLFGEGLEGLGSWLAGLANRDDANPGEPHRGDGNQPELVAPLADSDLAGLEPSDPIEDGPPPAAGPDLDQDEDWDLEDDSRPAGELAPDFEPGSKPVPGSERVPQAELGQAPSQELGQELVLELGLELGQDNAGALAGPDATVAQGPLADPGQQAGSGADTPGAPTPDPSQLRGDGLALDQGDRLPQGADDSGSPRQEDPGSSQQESSRAGSGADQPASPGAPRDGLGRPRRPPFRRGGGRERLAAPEGPGDDFQFFQSLFAMAAEGLGREIPGLASPGGAESGPAAGDEGPEGPGESAHSGQGPGSQDGPPQGAVAIPLELLRQASGLGQVPAPASWQAQESWMPQDAPSLLAWWEALDGALQRRLRNLSNAVNGELVRLGISRSHLPIALLDAVLKGQLDPMPAPANLVRLQMPFGGDTPSSPGAGDASAAFPFGGPMDMVVLLLRLADLEFEAPALRVCRRRLEQNRARLRTMAQRHRYWQRRVQALEAERQWFQDSPNPSR